MLRAICFLLALSVPSMGQSVKVVLVGDSTVNDEGGWGTGFRACFGREVVVVNLALNGRSSKSFRDEGAWAKVMPEKPKYVLIQFGHNDQPGKGPERETDPNTTYRANLERYVDEVRASGGTPVLVTSIVRRVRSMSSTTPNPRRFCRFSSSPRSMSHSCAGKEYRSMTDLVGFPFLPITGPTRSTNVIPARAPRSSNSSSSGSSHRR